MQDPKEAQILQLDALFSADPQSAMNQAIVLVNQPDALTYVPIIFNVANNQYLISAAIQIFKNHIKTNWAALSESDRLEFRGFVTKYYNKCPNVAGIKSQLTEVVVKVGILSYPDEWPDYLSDLLYSEDFLQIKYFLEEIESSPITILPAAKKALITQELIKNSVQLASTMIQNFKIADSALCKFAQYLKWGNIQNINVNNIVFTEDPDAFGPLCSILQIEDIPEDFIQAAFNTAAQLQITDPTLFVRIIPVIQKHLATLEKSQCFHALNTIHMKLLDIDFVELLYYWEPFIVTIFSQFQKSGGVTPRFNLHYQLLVRIREYVIFHMIQPPDFIIPEEVPPTNDQLQRDNYNDMRSIILSFIGMTPKEVLDSFNRGLQFLRTSFQQDGFLSIIWALGCISGATNSQLESIFVVESMKFVLDVFKMPAVNKPVVASSFLFLASCYARAQKLTQQFIEVTINLAIQALDSLKTQKIAANTLLSITKHSSALISRIPPGLVEIIGGVSMSPDTFCVISEAAGRLYMAKDKIEPILNVLVTRWSNVSAIEILNFDVVREQQLVMNGFIGLSRANPIAIEKVVRRNRQMLIQITENFGKNVLSIFQESGYDAIGRDDLKLMLGFLQAETILFTELTFTDCGDILAMYGNFPEELRLPESLLLTEALFKADIESAIVMGLHETVIKPTEEMVSRYVGEYPEFVAALPKVMNAMANSYFEAIVPEDIEFLLGALSENNHVAVLGAIKALDTCVEKADLKLIDEPRNLFFRSFLGTIMYRIMNLITDPGHAFCFAQAMRFLRKLFDFVGTGKLRCQLFPDMENVPGMSTYLSTITVQDFPLVTIPEMVALTSTLFQKLPIEQFEELLAQYVARTRQTTPGETLSYLRLQKFKDSVSDFLYT